MGWNELTSAARIVFAVAVASVIDRIRPAMLEAIDVYLGPAETPLRSSRGGATCGAILIWTRSDR